VSSHPLYLPNAFILSYIIYLLVGHDFIKKKKKKIKTGLNEGWLFHLNCVYILFLNVIYYVLVYNDFIVFLWSSSQVKTFDDHTKIM
jgi:hypothetical protein